MQIETSEKICIGKVLINAGSDGQFSARFESGMTASEAISTALSKALQGKTFSVPGFGEKPIEYIIDKTNYDGKTIRLEGPITHTIGKTRVAGRLVIQLPLDGGSVKADMKLDQAALKSMAFRLSE
jgi:hypothetical protein